MPAATTCLYGMPAAPSEHGRIRAPAVELAVWPTGGSETHHAFDAGCETSGADESARISRHRCAPSDRSPLPTFCRTTRRSLERQLMNPRPSAIRDTSIGEQTGLVEEISAHFVPEG